MAKRIQQNRPPSPPKYPPSSLSIDVRFRHVIFVEGNVSDVALQGPPAAPLEYLLLAENGNPILMETGDYIEIEHT